MSRRQKIGLTDVAKACGVSVATVSRALSQPGVVHPETLAKIRHAAARLGYVPNRKASALASGRSNTIGVAVPTLNSAIFAETLQEMQKTLAVNGYQLLVASHEYEAGAESGALSQLVSQGVDGLIVVGGARPQSTWRLIEEADLPLVQMWEGRAENDCVAVDNHQAGYMVAQHLLALGHRRFGVICGHLRNNDRQRARVEGVRQALSEVGLALPPPQISEQHLTVTAGRGGCAALLELVPRPTAIIGTVDVLAIGAMIEAQGRGISVPESLSFAGIDNIEFAAHLSPSLTSVDIPAAAIGAETAARMLELLQSPPQSPPQPPQRRTLPINIVIRHSTAPPQGYSVQV